MELALNVVLVIAALLCGIVAGFVFAFAIVVMPGIAGMKDREYLRAFKVMDGVIQKNQPVFILVWLGSAVAVIIAAVTGFFGLEGTDFWLTAGACGLYILGVQIPTVVFNVPLNNRLQTLDLDEMSDQELAAARRDFEGPWLRWNLFRTFAATVTSIILLVVLLRIDG